MGEFSGGPGLRASISGGTGSIPGQGTKIPKDVQHSQKKKKSIYLLKYLNIHMYVCVCVCVCVCVYKTTLKVHSNYLICRKTQDWGDRVASKSLDLEMESSKKQMSRHGSKGEETW